MAGKGKNSSFSSPWGLQAHTDRLNSLLYLCPDTGEREGCAQQKSQPKARLQARSELATNWQSKPKGAKSQAMT